MKPIDRMRAEATHYTEEQSEICGYWHDYLILVELEPMGDWYIRVNHPDGCYLYDGWWTDSANKSAADAVEEAFRGAELLES